jgi:hypothetical protein
MNRCKLFVVAGVGLAAMLALVPLGCSKPGSSPGIDPNSEAAHIGKAGRYVAKFLSDNKGHVPKNTGEMKDWAAKNSITEDDLLSTRDHEPYEIHEVAQGPLKELIILETTGAKGKKFMWQATNRIPIGFEVTQEEIDKTLKPKAGGKGRPF